MGVRLTDPIPVPFPRAAPSPGMTTTTPSAARPPLRQRRGITEPCTLNSKKNRPDGRFLYSW